MKKKIILTLCATVSGMMIAGTPASAWSLFGNESSPPVGCYHGARSPEVVKDYMNQPTGNKSNAGAVKNAIVRAASRQEWRVVSSSGSKVVLKRQVRDKHTMVVTVSYSARSYSIQYKSSDNLNVATCSDGKAYIHPFYNRWVGELNSAIKKGLGV